MSRVHGIDSPLELKKYLDPIAKEANMAESLIDTWMEEWVQKGVQQGREDGRQEGR